MLIMLGRRTLSREAVQAMASVTINLAEDVFAEDFRDHDVLSGLRAAG
jgi:hypothetical protein